ncbi:MAG: hypothetical protein ABL949_01250 [Fimbriimonadaceae bacterium]
MPDRLDASVHSVGPAAAEILARRVLAFCSLLLRSATYGYPALSGNHVYIKFDIRRGRVTSIDLEEGWQYEAPRIAVTAAYAKQKAVEALGGEAGEWQLSLTYQAGDAAGPRELYELTLQHVQRLCYEMSCPRGTVVIDSVTGETVWAGSPSGGVKPPATKAPPKPANITSNQYQACFRVAEAILGLTCISRSPALAGWDLVCEDK